MSEKQTASSEANSRPRGLRRMLGRLMGTDTIAVEAPQEEKRVVTAEQVEAALASLRANIQPAVEEITAAASEEDLSMSELPHMFIHQKKDWGPDNKYPGRLLVSDVTLKPGGYEPIIINDDTPQDAVRGVQVVVMGSDHPPKLQDSMGYAVPTLVFMDDGNILRKFSDGTYATQHLPLSDLSPVDALTIIESVTAGIEEHRMNP